MAQWDQYKINDTDTNNDWSKYAIKTDDSTADDIKTDKSKTDDIKVDNNKPNDSNTLSSLWDRVVNNPTIERLFTGHNAETDKLNKDAGINQIVGPGLMTIPGIDKLANRIKDYGQSSGNYWGGFAGSIGKDLVDMASSGFDPRTVFTKKSPMDLFPILNEESAAGKQVLGRAPVQVGEATASTPSSNTSKLLMKDGSIIDHIDAEEHLNNRPDLVPVGDETNFNDLRYNNPVDLSDKTYDLASLRQNMGRPNLSVDEVNKLFSNPAKLEEGTTINFGNKSSKLNNNEPRVTSLKPATPELIEQAQAKGPDVIHLKTADKTQLENAAQYGYKFEGVNSDGSLRLRKSIIDDNISSNKPPSDNGGNNGGDEPPKEFLFKNNQPKPFLEALKDASKTPFRSAIDLTKSLVTAGHFSAPFRQGAMLLSHPSDWADAVGKMFQGAMSEDRMNLINQKITEMPSYQWAKKSGVVFTNLNDSPTLREDAIRSRLAESIPGYGKFVRLGNRAFNTFTNTLRANVAETLYNDAKDASKNLTGEDLIKANPDTNLNLSKQLAGFVNAGSGRGSLGSLEKYADGLNTIMFSPRLQASRLQIIRNIVSPGIAPQVRKESIKSLLALTSLGMTVNGLIKFGGGQTSLDPTNADFGKARIGNTRIDPWEGYQQYAVLATRLMKGQYTSSTTGKTSNLGLFGRQTGMNMVEDFAANKTTPPLKFAYDMLNAKNIHGQSSFQIGPEIASQIAPIIAQQITEVANENPELLPLTIPLGTFGLGISAYRSR